MWAGGIVLVVVAFLALVQRSLIYHPLRLDAAWGDPDGRIALVRVHAVASVTGLDAAEALGQQVVELLRQGGATRPADLTTP